jgi:hypothetical protein
LQSGQEQKVVLRTTRLSYCSSKVGFVSRKPYACYTDSITKSITPIWSLVGIHHSQVHIHPVIPLQISLFVQGACQRCTWICSTDENRWKIFLHGWIDTNMIHWWKEQKQSFKSK